MSKRIYLGFEYDATKTQERFIDEGKYIDGLVKNRETTYQKLMTQRYNCATALGMSNIVA